MKNKKIAILGASSVFGKVDSRGGFVGRLKNWYEAGNREARSVYNLGIPGDTTTDMRKRAQVELSTRKPDIIIFQLGSNDVAHVGSVKGKANTTKTAFRKNVIQLLKIAKKITKQVFVVSAYPIVDSKTQPFKGTNKYYLMNDLVEYAKETKKICKEERIPYVDIFTVLLKEKYSQYMYPDGLHCNDRGHKRVFQEIQQFLVNKHYL
ncbi:MAG TPA: GDSL-type esterase/lipase family protein [Patescibacteria group bacterium]|nr:GDSL-type esterase/lipase family protein [Patescibacteria group bacterium]